MSPAHDPRPSPFTFPPLAIHFRSGKIFRRATHRLVLSTATIFLIASGSAASAAEPAPPAAVAVADPTADAAKLEFFEKQMRPLLVARCQECHTGEKPKGGFRLDSREHALAGGDTGAAIVPGKPDESLLIDAVRYGATYQMPPKGRLPAEEVATLVQWVRLGAPWPQSATPATSASSSAPAFDFEKRAKHWCFQPLADVVPPAVKDESWLAGPIDRFILAALEAKGFVPAPPVDKRVWLRRVTYDLLGLPPMPAEMNDFLADDSPQAFERVVDRLLASPHYGERRARQWLDLARFAETYGHEHDYEIPRAFEYRDYLIRAFNADLPYDQFVVEQLAGDLLDPPRRHPTERFNESILGTAFYFVGEGVHSPVDVRKDGADRVDNQIDVLAKTFLGLTVSCARCHDHKFDAIRQQDYYALAGYLRSSRYQQAYIDDDTAYLPLRDELLKQRGLERGQFAQYTTAALLKRTEQLAAWLADPARGQEEAWKNTLAEAAAQPDNVFHAWAVLGANPTALSEEEFLRRRKELMARLAPKQITQQEAGPTPAANAAVDEVFADLDGADYRGWISTGRAWDSRPARPNDLVSAGGLAGDKSLLPGLRPLGVSAAHSGLLANKLQGVLRSPTFTISQPKILYRVWGTGGQVRLIIDGFQLIQDPIYGGLKFGPGPDRPHWQAQDVSKWIGHRAYIELIDDGDGYVALDRVVFSSGGTPDLPANPLIVAMLRDAAPKNAGEMAAAYQAIMVEAITRWSSGASPEGPESALIATLIVSPLATSNLADLSPEALQLQRDLAARLIESAAESEKIAARAGAPRQALAIAA
ncbi:MAG TPA: DUF1549 domain-containing protein, partial [Pirellulales bacterium]